MIDPDTLGALNIQINQILIDRKIELPNDKILTIVMLTYADAVRRKMKVNADFVEQLINLASESKIDRTGRRQIAEKQ